MQEIFDLLSPESDIPSNTLVMSSLDLDQGFHQLVLQKSSRPLTTFTTPLGNWSYKRVPMGLRTSPWQFLRTMNLVLNSDHDSAFKYVLNYMDDILVYSSTVKQHLEHLEKVFSKFKAAGLQLSPRKCQFGRKKVSFLGMVLTPEGISPDPDKVRAIAEYQVPKNPKQLRSYLGAAGWFRRFIPGYGSIAAPLYQLLRKDQKFIWTPEHQSAFERIRTALSTEPLLVFPNWKQEFYIFSDASGYSVGGCLAQKYPRVGFRPIAYCGRAMTNSEKAMSISLQEGLAAVYAIKQFLSYVKFSHFFLVTDHMSLKYLFESVEPRGMFGRWLAFLSTLNFSVMHRPGSDMNLPDALSRRQYDPTDSVKLDPLFQDPVGGQLFPFGIDQSTQTDTVNINAVSMPSEPVPDIFHIDPSIYTGETHSNAQATNVQAPCLAARVRPGVCSHGNRNKTARFPVPKYTLAQINRDKFIAEQKRDPYLCSMRAYLEGDQYPEDAELARKLQIDQVNFFIDDDMLYHIQVLPKRGRESQDPLIQLAVPVSLIVPVLEAHHDDIYGGHLGISKTLERLRRRFWFPKFQELVIQYIRSCDTCLQSKIPRHLGRAQIHHLPRVNQPLTHLCIDFVTVCPSEPIHGRVYKYLLTVLCLHSRYLWAFPCEKEDADTVANLLVQELFLKFGLPDTIHSDRGSHFDNVLVRTLYDTFGIRCSLCCPYRGQSNGVLERKHAVLKGVLKSYVHDQGAKWPKYLNAALFVINNSEMESALGHSPSFLLFGVTLKNPLDSRLELPEQPLPAPVTEHLEALLSGLEQARRTVTASLDKAEHKTELQFAKFKTRPPLQVGSIVYVYRPALDKSGVKALRFSNIGPFYICERVGPCAFHIRNLKTNRLVKTPIHSRTFVRWAWKVGARLRSAGLLPPNHMQLVWSTAS